MAKHYRTILISFIGFVGIGLSVTLFPQPLALGSAIQWGVSTAHAEDSGSHSYGADGYDERGRDREGYDRGGYSNEGYDKQGHDREGYDKEGYRDDGHHRDGHYDSGRDRHGRHDKPQDAEQDATPTAGGEAQSYKASKPTVKQY